MPRASKTVAVPRREAHLFLAKADEFMEEARAAAAAGRSDAAMLSAIHAAISAAHAVTVALAGRRSADPDHQAVADLSDQAVHGETEGACLNKFVEHWKEHGDAIDAWLRPAVGGRA